MKGRIQAVAYSVGRKEAVVSYSDSRLGRADVISAHSPVPCGEQAHRAKQAPRTPTSAVDSCMRAALQRSKPALSRMAKSPTCSEQHSRFEISLGLFHSSWRKVEEFWLLKSS